METVSDQKDPQPKEPDVDTIKLFVGQIPRSYNEADCMKLFEEYGRVHQLNIHRDKTTGDSKGCCFVTFFHRSDALKAQGALHNTRVLPGMHNAMQVKPADLENRNERKLFIGMLSRTATEEDVRKMFESFGTIEEVTVLRENGKSKGCAFVTFVSRSCAYQAIRQMHQSMTFEGCTKPMVVKLADTTKDKETKKGPDASSPNDNLLQQLLQGNSLMSGGNQVNQLSNQFNTLGALLQNPGVAALLGTGLSNATSSQSSTAVASGDVPSSSRASQARQHAASPGRSDTSSGPSLLQQQQQQQQLQALQQQQQYLELFKQQQAVFDPNSSQLFLSGQQPLVSYSHNALIQPQPSPIFQQVAAMNPLTSPPLAAQSTMIDPSLSGFISRSLPVLPTGLVDTTALASTSANNSASANTSKGPEGCNLFIYHLPQDFGDEDLRSLFAYFGHVLSAKVFIDKQTNLSKCFGFVSFDNAVNAQKAISGMNGFQIGAKRLKVQLKRGGEKPYDRPDQSSQAKTATS